MKTIKHTIYLSLALNVCFLWIIYNVQKVNIFKTLPLNRKIPKDYIGMIAKLLELKFTISILLFFVFWLMKEFQYLFIIDIFISVLFFFLTLESNQILLVRYFTILL